MSYGQNAQLLAELFPVDEQINAATIRNHTQELAERLEAELGDEQFMFVEGCPRDWAALPRPDMPLTVGIDGGYVRPTSMQADQPRHCFEVITVQNHTHFGFMASFGDAKNGHG
jgi:hypothetical protein